MACVFSGEYHQLPSHPLLNDPGPSGFLSATIHDYSPSRQIMYSSIPAEPDSMSFELISNDPFAGRLYDDDATGLVGSFLYDESRTDAVGDRDFVLFPAPAPTCTVDLDFFTDDVLDHLDEYSEYPDDPWTQLPRPLSPYTHTEEVEGKEEEPVEVVASTSAAAVSEYEYEDQSSSDNEVASDSDDDYRATPARRTIRSLPRRAVPASPLAASQPIGARTQVSATASRAVNKKRAAPKKRASGPRKRAAISTSTSVGPVAVPIPTRSGSPTPSTSDTSTTAPDIIGQRKSKYTYEELVEMGCTPLANGGMRCYYESPVCLHVTNNSGDMGRHVVIHDRAGTQLFCKGCPGTFARIDSLMRHFRKKRLSSRSHFTAVRRALLVDFKAQEDVVEMYALLLEPSSTKRMIRRIKAALDQQFEDFVAANPPTPQR
ncbi:hypothetical protein C8R46DRAFT_1246149 [Mycena filopes]|nr:hypothetical protein C8R46DRAFT_1246149 [Mycena filopes]